MINEYKMKYREYFNDLLEVDFQSDIYPPINHDLDLNDNDSKRKIFELNLLTEIFVDNPKHLLGICKNFAKDIKNEYDNKEMDLTEFFLIAMKKQISNNDKRIENKVKEIQSIKFKTKSNFHMIEMIYHFHNNQHDVENESLKLFIESIAEYEHSINEHNFFKTILFSRYVQEHFVHFVEERVKTLTKSDYAFNQVQDSIDAYKKHSYGVERTSLPDLLNIFLKSNRYITHEFIPNKKIEKLKHTSHELWKVSSYFLHAGNHFMADNFKVDSFKNSFNLIRHNGLQYIFNFIEYLFPILYKDEWNDLITIMSSSPLEFNHILKIDENSIDGILDSKINTLKVRNFRKKNIYENLTDEEIHDIHVEYNIPNDKKPTETEEDFHMRIYSFLERKFNASNDLYEKAIILRRTTEIINHMIVGYHEHFNHFGELVKVKSQINGISHVDYKELERNNFENVMPLIMDKFKIDELHNQLLTAFAHLAKEHIQHMNDQKNK